MTDEQTPNQPTFLQVMDESMQENVKRLEEQISTLHHEITRRLNAMDDNPSRSAELQKKLLLQFQEELEATLEDITELTSMIVAEDLSTEAFLEMNKETIAEFQHLITDNLAKISEISRNLTSNNE